MRSEEEEVQTGRPVDDNEEPKSSTTQEATTTDQGERPASLNAKNWLNLIAYILNVVFTPGAGTAGWVGTSSTGEISSKYQTLVTPSSSAFTIWAVIFFVQGIWAVLQMLPRYRAHSMVQKAVGYWYVWACIFQVAWTFSFGYEVIWLSCIFIIGIWLALCAIVYRQYYTESSGSSSSCWEFWWLRFPFAIHCGWLTAASALNINIVVVDAMAPADVQLAVGIVSLAYLHAVSVWVLFGIQRNPNYTIAGVLAWANGWIYSELQDPKDSIVALFNTDIIPGVSYAAVAVAVIITGQIVVRFGMYVGPKDIRKTNNDNGAEEEHLVDKNKDELEKAMSENEGKDENQELIDAKV